MKNLKRALVVLALAALMLTLLWVPYSAAAGGCTHIVQRGETLTGIARCYGTSVWAIAQANGLANPNYIRVGQRLDIPTCGGYWERTHVVQRGETLTGIARWYGTSVGAIAWMNGLTNTNYIRVGQRLVIPW